MEMKDEEYSNVRERRGLQVVLAFEAVGAPAERRTTLSAPDIEMLETQGAGATFIWENNWLNAEIADLSGALAWTRAALAGDEAFYRSVDRGVAHDDAVEAAVKGYDETLWLERSARVSWLERKREWVGEQLAAIEAQRREAEGG